MSTQATETSGREFTFSDLPTYLQEQFINPTGPGVYVRAGFVRALENDVAAALVMSELLDQVEDHQSTILTITSESLEAQTGLSGGEIGRVLKKLRRRELLTYASSKNGWTVTLDLEKVREVLAMAEQLPAETAMESAA